VREVESGTVRLVSESVPGGFDRVRAALAGPVESHKWVNTPTVRDRLYTELRVIGGHVATAGVLAEAAGTKVSTARDYLRNLKNAGLMGYGPDGWRATGELPVERPRAPEHRTLKRREVGA